MNSSNSPFSKFISQCIDRYRIVYLGMAILIILGLFNYKTLARESKPEVVFPRVKINVNYPGATPEDVELLVTNRLESVLAGVDDIEFLTSSSLAGRSEIQLDFFPEVNIDDKINEINQAILSVTDLPDDSEAPTVKVSTTANRAFMVLSLSGDLSPTELKSSADLLMDDLLFLDGVSDVKISGDINPEIRITVDQARLAEFNLTVDDLVQSVNLRHKDTPAGDVIFDGVHYYIRVLASYGRIDELRTTLIPLPGGEIKFLKDVALVEETYKPAANYSRRSVNLGAEDAAMKAAITISLYRDGGTDIIGPSHAVKAVIENSGDGRFPEGLDILVIQDDAVSVQEDLDNVLGNAVSGLLIVLIVLYLFLGFREAFIAALIIPFSLFFSFIALNIAGMTFNTMTLLAMIIALGLLVDNAIVVVENVVVFRLNGNSRIQAAKQGTAEVAPAILAATLTTMAAFIPLAFMEGRIGLIISVIPITIIFTVGASFLISLSVTPTLAARLLPKTHRLPTQKEFSWKREISEALIIVVLVALAFSTNGRPGVLSLLTALLMAAILTIRIAARYKKVNAFDGLAGTYQKLLQKVITNPKSRVIVPLITFIAFIAVLSTVPLGLIKIELFPVVDESSLYVVLSTPEYSSLKDTDDVTRQIENLLLNLDGVGSIYSEVGVLSMRESQIVVNLKSGDERSWTTKEKVPELLKQFATVPGAKIAIGTSAGGKIANSPIQIKLTGNDLSLLDTTSRNLIGMMSDVDGVGNPYSDYERGYPEIQVLMRPIQAADMGIDATSLGQIVKSFISGQSSGTLTTPEGELPIRFATTDKKLDSAQDMGKILIPLKDGTLITLSQVAALAETSGFGTIRHNDGERTVTVYAQLMPEANIRNAVTAIDKIIAENGLPDGVTYEWAGDAADLDASFNDMTLNLALALLVVFLILSFQFNSLTQPLVILLSVPMATIGVFAGLLITGNNFGLYAFMGVIALVGIAVNDAIVLIDSVNRNRKNGMPIDPSLTDAGKSRFGPVLATTLTTIGGILPLAFKDVNFAQLSISLIFGLLASTILTLIVLPVSYRIVEDLKVRIKHKIPVFIDEEIDE
jgi:multidrug efflux pump subunit AcrB